MNVRRPQRDDSRVDTPLGTSNWGWKLSAIMIMAMMIYLLVVFLYVLILQLSWNHSLSEIFKWPEVTLTQAFFLLVLVAMLVPNCTLTQSLNDCSHRLYGSSQLPSPS